MLMDFTSHRHPSKLLGHFLEMKYKGVILFAKTTSLMTGLYHTMLWYILQASLPVYGEILIHTYSNLKGQTVSVTITLVMDQLSRLCSLRSFYPQYCTV